MSRQLTLSGYLERFDFIYRDNGAFKACFAPRVGDLAGPWRLVSCDSHGIFTGECRCGCGVRRKAFSGVVNLARAAPHSDKDFG